MAAVLTVLAVLPWEAAEAFAVVSVQLRFAAATVVTGLPGAGVILEHGYAAGAQGILLPEDGRTHQSDLEAVHTGRYQQVLPQSAFEDVYETKSMHLGN